MQTFQLDLKLVPMSSSTNIATLKVVFVHFSASESISKLFGGLLNFAGQANLSFKTRSLVL